MSTFVLKVLAVVSMTIDHTGMALFPEQQVFRIIGRLAFPLYAFLCAQGAVKTKNIDKYLLRLGIFALLSEIPFDLLTQGTLFSLWGQNVFVTLFLGVLAVKLYRKHGNLTPVVFCAFGADLLLSDYGWYGVALIFVFYYYREVPKNQLAAFAVLTGIHLLYLVAVGAGQVAANQIWCLTALVPIYFYNGQKGPGTGKLLFYAYYPLHLLVLYFLTLNINLFAR